MPHRRAIERLRGNPAVVAAVVATIGVAAGVASFEREPVQVEQLVLKLLDRASRRVHGLPVEHFTAGNQENTTLGFFAGGTLVVIVVKNGWDAAAIRELVQGVRGDVLDGS